MIKTGGQLRPPVFCSYILPEGETGMAKTVIRPAAEEDIPAIIALYRQLDSAMVALQPEFFCEAPREVDEIRKAVRADDADFLRWSTMRAGRRRSAVCCPTVMPVWGI